MAKEYVELNPHMGQGDIEWDWSEGGEWVSTFNYGVVEATPNIKLGYHNMHGGINFEREIKAGTAVSSLEIEALKDKGVEIRWQEESQ